MQNEQVMDRESFIPQKDVDHGPTESVIEQMRARAREVRKLLTTHKINIAELGSTAGKMMVRELAFLQILSNLPQSTIQEKIDSMNSFYDELFQGTDQIMSGFAGEFAVGYAISEQLGYDVSLATPEEDMEGKIDLIVNLDDGDSPLAIQVKSILMDGRPNKLIYDPSKGELHGFAPNNTDEEEIAKIQRDGGKMVEYCQKAGLRPLFIIIPSPGSAHPLYNQKSALPVQRTAKGNKTEMADQLWFELQEGGFISWE